jgi:hypothetical protein
MKALATALALALSVAAAPAAARCTASDAWTGPDKRLHMGLGAVFGYAGTMQTRDPLTGFYVGTAVGALKEVIDASGSGTCSLQDFAVTALGAAVGAYGGHLHLRLDPARKSAEVAFATRF